MSHPTPFGKYLLLDKIGTGGMAELYLAKQTGLSGFEKVVAIKRILPHLTQGTEFISMFVNEAKLAALLTHQNIVQIYDLGSVDQAYYIAMEYVMGKDLKTVLQQGRSRSMPLSIGDALLIVSKICSALDYAHRKSDLQGNDLHLVHRDISPQNILVSYEGEVKLVDFGIAKAAMGGQETKTGILKGKLAYMSPEQAWGKPVDGRSDLFALGIVLYEAVTGERLFTGNDEISILEKVRKAEIAPPTRLNPAIPPELEAILERALAKEVEARYQSASEMERALEGLITQKGYAFSSLSLSHYMKQLFDHQIAEDTRRFQLVTRPERRPAEGLDRSTVIRPVAPANAQAAAVKKSISQSKIILPPPRGRRFSRWVSLLFFIVSGAAFLTLLLLSNISFVTRMRANVPLLEEMRLSVEATLQEKGVLAYLDQFKSGLFRLVEQDSPSSPSIHTGPTDESIAIALAKPAPNGPTVPPASPAPDETAAASGATPALPARDIPTLYQEAKEDYNAGRLDEVEKKLRQIIEVDPNQIQAYHLLGTVYEEKKEPDAALRIFADAAPLFQNDPLLHYDLGFLYFKKGVDSLAAQELSLAVKLAPQAPEGERAREILAKLDHRSQPSAPPSAQPAASFGKKRIEPLRPSVPSPPVPRPEQKEEPPAEAAAPAAPSTASLHPDDPAQIRALIANQKRALENRDIDQVLRGHLHPPPPLRQKLGQWFERFDRLSANYEIYEIKIDGNEASASLLQTVVLQSQKSDVRQVEKMLVYWKLVRSKDEWKIAQVNVVEKY
ncbi:MAG: protein kinase [Nitrospirae bacterium]|nr:protein kinase [Candidatus Manganitrophaceae bacterium]